MICENCGHNNHEIVKGFGVADVVQAVLMGAGSVLMLKYVEFLKKEARSGACDCNVCVQLRREVVSDGPAPRIADETN